MKQIHTILAGLLALAGTCLCAAKSHRLQTSKKRHCRSYRALPVSAWIPLLAAGGTWILPTQRFTKSRTSTRAAPVH